MLTDAEIPTGRLEREIWLAGRVEKVARIARARMHGMIRVEFAEFAASLTAAAGDLSLFDDIPSKWLTVVDDELVPILGETYLRGSVTAWVGLRKEPTAKFAAQWEAVTNEAAVSYMAGATNRLAAVGDQTWGLIRNKAADAMTRGLSTEDLKASIEAIGQFTEFRADTIARTETVGAYVQGDMAGARALGSDGPVEKVWVATLDNRTRDAHSDAHDQVRLLDEPFEVDGELMDSPHDPGGSAENVVNCRCYAELLYPGDLRPDGTIVGEPASTVAGEVTTGDG